MNRNASVALDQETVEMLESLARSWGISKEEALRRAVAEAKSVSKEARLRALSELQRRMGLTAEKARAWQESVMEGRR